MMPTTLAVFALISLLILLVAHLMAHRKLSHVPPESGRLPPISVLRPVKGLDEGMAGNLAALARQDYPEFEIVICAEDADDPALACARSLRVEFPQVSITILVGSAQRGLNPKVRLLDFMARHARFDTLLVSDSNVRPGPGYLTAIAREQAGGDNAMVSCLVAGVGENSVGAAMENLHLNTTIAPSIALTDAAGHACVIGKSMLFRRSDLARLGGFEPVRDVLAEDYLLGRAFQRAGGRITLSPQVAPVFNQRRTVREFVGRHQRWCQMRFRVSPVTYFLELLLNPTPAWLALALVGPALLGAAGIAAKVLADAALSRRLTGRWNHPRALLLVPVKDLLLFAVWLAAMFRRRIQWRGNALLMGWGSKLSRLPAPTLVSDSGAAEEPA